ncbi:hypothetical protein L228DRAFT_271749 [Xylona heveae TC161]|uniref:Pua rna binding domain-containing protein n=1 Tax=Xylona heveae (strain CBS 132557 / TC161) TaxID=1328760 RepID=A0A164Z9Q0_XYLHT|nr:hypothetical protein L228DRAFT_271749 [Xylona heveae TC161]KZF18851.1 hypothetical protein L228DRAFT_271749 [Xylona heveae TC161]
MPLVVPGINSNDGSKEDQKMQWMNKLVGKKIDESSHSETTFAKTDLPEEHRIIAPGSMVTKDFREDRLNVHVDDNGTVTHVDYN